MSDICGDNRFEIIAEAKSDLLEATNINDSPEEMAVLDNVLFRCWQMGWLKKYELNEFEWCNRGENPCKEYDQEKHCCHRWSSFIRKTVEDLKIVHCNECRFGESVDGEWDKYRCNCPEHHNRSVIWFGADYCSYGVKKGE